MKLTINGEARDFDAPRMTVAALLEALGLADRRVAVENNQRLVKRGTWAEAEVTDGDVVEIVQFVGGGA